MSGRSRGGRGGAARRRIDVRQDTRQRAQAVVRGQQLELGDLSGEEQAPVIATFRYFGETYTVNPNVSEVDIIDFMDDASRVSATDPNAITIVKSFGRRILHPEEFDDFWEAARDHRQDADAIMTTLWRVLEGVTSRPTSPPFGSSDGRPGTSPSSPPGASRPDSGRFPDRPGDRELIRDGMARLRAEEDPLRARFLAQIKRFEDQGLPHIAAQVAVAAEARGVDVSREPELSASATG